MGELQQNIEKNKNEIISGDTSVLMEGYLDMKISKDLTSDIGGDITHRNGGETTMHTDGKTDITSNTIVNIAKK